MFSKNKTTLIVEVLKNDVHDVKYAQVLQNCIYLSIQQLLTVIAWKVSWSVIYTEQYHHLNILKYVIFPFHLFITIKP